jgi:lysophospholipase L1-like esterase
MNPRLKRVLQNLGLTVGTFLLCGLLLETGLRLAGYGNVEIYEPHPVLYWRLKPNQNCFTKIDRKPVHVNSLGTRGPEFQPTKPANTLRILSLGDSRTFGWGLSEAETYSGLLEQWLQQRLGSKQRVEVINAGVNAWSYAQMHVFFRDFGLKYQPDFVLLADANLWTQFSEASSPEFIQSFLRRVRLKNFLRRFATYHYVFEYKLKEVYERTRTKFIPIDPRQDPFFKEQQQRDPDAFFRQHIEGVCRLARSNHIAPVLIYLPTLEHLATNEPSNVLRVKLQVSQQLHVPLVDLTPELKPLDKAAFLPGDLAHLNAAGNELVARRVFATLTNLLVP